MKLFQEKTTKFYQRFLNITDGHRKKLGEEFTSEEEIRNHLQSLDPEALGKLLTERELENYVKSISCITKQIEKSDLILIGRKDNINSDELLEISHHINLGINAMAMNKDLTYPATGNKQIPGNGAIVKIIEENTNQKIESFGKPDVLYTEYLKNNKPTISFIVGDRVDTDIALGNNLGANTFLVKSSIENFMNVDLADYYFESFSESVSFIIKNL